MTSSNEPQAVWSRYVESWKAPTIERRRELYASCLSPRCTYTDPLATAHGWDELAGYMTEFHRQIPGGHFVTEQFFAHDGHSIARWRMVAGDGTTLGDGMSYGEYGEDGKLVTMRGFFTPPGTGAS
jgi:hypothetical protein